MHGSGGAAGQGGTSDAYHATRIVKVVQTLLAGRTRLTRDQKRRVLDSIVTRIDARAERVAGDLRRDERGRVAPGRAASWALTKIEFRLALPPDEAACGVPPEPGGRGAASCYEAAEGDDALVTQIGVRMEVGG